jgi:ABC-type molybdate transport system substrate-binding protein
MPIPSHADETKPESVRVFAAGSLRPAINQIAAAFSTATGIRTEITFGPSGVLRQRIEAGEPADLFTSADMASPRTLARAGKASPAVRFARNKLCALVRPGLAVTPATLLDVLLDPAIKLGTSTPHADPAGDYTWAMFVRADAVRPGSQAMLEAKALQLFGGAHSTLPPAGQDVFAWHIREGRADLFIGYCSAGPSFKDALPGGEVVALPADLTVGADYGLAVIAPNNAGADRLALFVLSEEGQGILTRNGFEAPLESK